MMESTTRKAAGQAVHEPAVPPLRWRSWPLVEYARWSWLVVLSIVALSVGVWFIGGTVLVAVVTAVGFTFTIWSFCWPTEYEIDAHGLRRSALRRSWLIPWHAVRAYQLRTRGVVLYQRIDPTKIDLLRSLYIPYPPDADEMIAAMREHLPHAAELPS